MARCCLSGLTAKTQILRNILWQQNLDPTLFSCGRHFARHRTRDNSIAHNPILHTKSKTTKIKSGQLAHTSISLCSMFPFMSLCDKAIKMDTLSRGGKSGTIMGECEQQLTACNTTLTQTPLLLLLFPACSEVKHCIKVHGNVSVC